MAKKIKYTEPVGYFPKSIRKELGLGEYSKEVPTKKESAKKEQKKNK